MVYKRKYSQKSRDSPGRKKNFFKHSRQVDIGIFRSFAQMRKFLYLCLIMKPFLADMASAHLSERLNSDTPPEKINYYNIN